MALSLRPYQQEALDAIDANVEKGVSRQLVVIPTGGGKTVCFSQLPVRHPGRMLVIAHREELLVQAKDKIQWANPTLHVDIEQGSNHADPEADVVVASVATLGRKGSKRIEKFPRDAFPNQVVDEAHHAAAPSYVRIFDYFNEFKLRLGVTATPQRGDKKSLANVFDKISYFIPMDELIKQGYLSDLVGYRVRTNTDISAVKTRAGDYIDSQLAETIDTPERNDQIVKAYHKYASGLRAIVFTANVQHANNVTTAFSNAGVSVACVVGSTPGDDRSRALAEFSSGETRVIVNVGVLTEGFDEPKTECLILARPTKSQLLYTQIIGRGMRIAEGKEHCIVIDMADTTKGVRHYHPADIQLSWAAGHEPTAWIGNRVFIIRCRG